MKKVNILTGAVLVLATVVACKFSTANISSLKLSKDKGAAQEMNTFAQADTFYGVATVSNVPDKVKVTGRMIIIDVAGEKAGPIPGLESVVELAGSGTATFTFSAPPAGWPKGKYALEVSMLNDGDEAKDAKKKTAEFTIQ